MCSVCVCVCLIACDISAMAALSFPHSPVKLKQIFAPILLNSFDLCDVRVWCLKRSARVFISPLPVFKPRLCVRKSAADVPA